MHPPLPIAARVLIELELDRKKRAAISVIQTIGTAKARGLPTWWQWTVWLAVAITVRRIEAARG